MSNFNVENDMQYLAEMSDDERSFFEGFDQAGPG